MSNSPEAASLPDISPLIDRPEVRKPIFKIGDRVAITGVRELKHGVWDNKPSTLNGTIDALPVTNASDIAMIERFSRVAFYQGTQFNPARPAEAGSAIYYRVDCVEILDGKMQHYINYFAENQVDVPSDVD